MDRDRSDGVEKKKKKKKESECERERESCYPHGLED